MVRGDKTIKSKNCPQLLCKWILHYLQRLLKNAFIWGRIIISCTMSPNDMSLSLFGSNSSSRAAPALLVVVAMEAYLLHFLTGQFTVVVCCRCVIAAIAVLLLWVYVCVKVYACDVCCEDERCPGRFGLWWWTDVIVNISLFARSFYPWRRSIEFLSAWAFFCMFGYGSRSNFDWKSLRHNHLRIFSPARLQLITSALKLNENDDEWKKIYIYLGRSKIFVFIFFLVMS